MTTTARKQKVQLVKGEFTPAEAIDIIETLIYEKIKFHKTQRFQQWVRDQECDTAPLESRVQELSEARKVAKAFLQQAAQAGFNVEINGELVLSFTEPSGKLNRVTIKNSEN